MFCSSFFTQVETVHRMALLPLALCLLIKHIIAIEGPCDIFATGSTPCVAAHSTVRALYGAFNGPLYQVKRASDNKTIDIGVVSTGGYADAASQVYCKSITQLNEFYP